MTCRQIVVARRKAGFAGATHCDRTSKMSWFSDLTGIESETPQTVSEFLTIEGSCLISAANSKRFEVGRLTTPSLAELRDAQTPLGGQISLQSVVADVQRLHLLPENAGATFQVASQFNLLEMAGPNFIPEMGVGLYQYDRTQGPACAIACGAGTIYRNYFAPVAGEIGQTAERQIDCLEDVGRALGQRESALWDMQNGYALLTPRGLATLEQRLQALSESEKDRLRSLLRIGLQSDTEVTLGNAGHRVTQVFCSAMPVAYGAGSPESWREIATLVLAAAYEATLLAAVENAARTGNNRVFLTLLGGGAFGNQPEWIADAILRALRLTSRAYLEVFLVSYGAPNPIASSVVTQWTDRA